MHIWKNFDRDVYITLCGLDLNGVTVDEEGRSWATDYDSFIADPQDDDCEECLEIAKSEDENFIDR